MKNSWRKSTFQQKKLTKTLHKNSLSTFFYYSAIRTRGWPSGYRSDCQLTSKMQLVTSHFATSQVALVTSHL